MKVDEAEETKPAPHQLVYMQPGRVDRWRVLKHLGFILAILIPGSLGLTGVAVVIILLVWKLDSWETSKFFGLLASFLLASLCLLTASFIREEYRAARWRWRNAQQWS